MFENYFRREILYDPPFLTLIFLKKEEFEVFLFGVDSLSKRIPKMQIVSVNCNNKSAESLLSELALNKNLLLACYFLKKKNGGNLKEFLCTISRLVEQDRLNSNSYLIKFY